MKESSSIPDTFKTVEVTQQDNRLYEDNDESNKRLRELGYQVEFRREMSFFGVLGMSFCAIGILTGMSSAFQTGLFSGGPLAELHLEICSLFMLFIALSLAEICIIVIRCQVITHNSPTMGGLYFWVCKMKPDAPALGCKTIFLSNSILCTGWIYTIAMVLTGTSGNLSVALYIASLVEIGQQTTLKRVEIAAIAWGVNIASGVLNTVGTKAIGRMSSFNMWWTVGGTLILVITLLVKAPEKRRGRVSSFQNSGAFVFTDYENFTGWQSKGFVVLLGFLQAVYTLEGCETAAQVAEEARRAEFLAPVAVVGSIIGSWVVGLAYMLALLFSVQSIPSVQSTSYAIPIAQLYFGAVGRRLTLMCLTIITLAQFMAAATAFTASSRLFYALARDEAFPMKRHFMSLNRFQAPFVGIWLSVAVGCLISCAYIGSVIAFNAILSSAAISVMLGYLQPIIIRNGGTWPLSSWTMVVVDQPNQLIGMHELLSSSNVCLQFVPFVPTNHIFICVLFILPTASPVTQLNMNYSVVSIGGIILIVGFTWALWGRRHFNGPLHTNPGFGALSKAPPSEPKISTV
ncbi:LOW QUALITY PROTEIN: hypothetical protein CVT25_004456 [Psilocybe cyanescens]|uniref:Amino acid permease/ SLC12A domain-containing protein n=1 Tax=Psilocybe cyanescens TaxID=93625 RepID=A0A409X2G0_PSICY|nr:LOW QUALITY PROTEIN: hypothetical protein CVT25_004456 [Psilocybe cyanescens]